MRSSKASTQDANLDFPCFALKSLRVSIYLIRRERQSRVGIGGTARHSAQENSLSEQNCRAKLQNTVERETKAFKNILTVLHPTLDFL
jgi:hypothetical protein